MTRQELKAKAKKVSIRRKRETNHPLEKSMKEYNVLSKGKTLSGHFSPVEAIDVLQTAKSRGRSVSEIVTAAVRFGLSAVKQQFPPIRPHS